MKKNKFKVIKILLLFFVITNIFLILPNISHAIADVTGDPDFWNPSNNSGDDSVSDKIAPILGGISIVGTIVSVITLSIIGYKIMFGGIEEKAKYKETLIPWAVGAFMLFSMTTIPDIIYDFVADKSVTSTLTESTDGGYALRVNLCKGGNILDGGRCPEQNCVCGGGENRTMYSGGYMCSVCRRLTVSTGNFVQFCDYCGKRREIRDGTIFTYSGSGESYGKSCMNGWLIPEKENIIYSQGCKRNMNFNNSCNCNGRAKDEVIRPHCSYCGKQLVRKATPTELYCPNCFQNYKEEKPKEYAIRVDICEGGNTMSNGTILSCGITDCICGQLPYVKKAIFKCSKCDNNVLRSGQTLYCDKCKEYLELRGQDIYAYTYNVSLCQKEKECINGWAIETVETSEEEVSYKCKRENRFGDCSCNNLPKEENEKYYCYRCFKVLDAIDDYYECKNCYRRYSENAKNNSNVIVF